MRTRAARELLWRRHGGRRHGGGVCLAPSMRGAACTHVCTCTCMHALARGSPRSHPPLQRPTRSPRAASGSFSGASSLILSNPLAPRERREAKTRGCSIACTPATAPLSRCFDLTSSSHPNSASQVGLSSTPLLTQASERDLAGRKMAAELISSRRVRESHRAVSR